MPVSDTPGPGEYDLTRRARSPTAFLGSTGDRRATLTSASDNPGPGAYSITDPRARQRSASTTGLMGSTVAKGDPSFELALKRAVSFLPTHTHTPTASRLFLHVYLEETSSARAGLDPRTPRLRHRLDAVDLGRSLRALHRAAARENRADATTLAQRQRQLHGLLAADLAGENLDGSPGNIKRHTRTLVRATGLETLHTGTARQRDRLDPSRPHRGTPPFNIHPYFFNCDSHNLPTSPPLPNVPLRVLQGLVANYKKT